MPLGAMQLKISYSAYGTDVPGDPRGDKVAAGVLYSLSKHTAAYGAYAYATPAVLLML